MWQWHSKGLVCKCFICSFAQSSPSQCCESHLLCPQPPRGSGSKWGGEQSVGTWGSARAQAVPPSTDVCVPPSTDVCVSVNATALAQSPSSPPAPCQAGNSGLSGRCWGHNCAFPWPVCAATLRSTGLRAVTGA